MEVEAAPATLASPRRRGERGETLLVAAEVQVEAISALPRRQEAAETHLAAAVKTEGPI